MDARTVAVVVEEEGREVDVQEVGRSTIHHHVREIVEADIPSEEARSPVDGAGVVGMVEDDERWKEHHRQPARESS